MKIALYFMSLFYILAGIMHFVRPRMYLKMMPPYLPFHPQLVYASGIMEIVAGLLLLYPATRAYGAWLTILILIIVFPANIQMAVNFYQKQHPYFWIAVLRLPLQLTLIWWAWLYTHSY